MGVNVLALLWGLAEATLFFIVPDVPLTFIALLKGRGAALRAACFAAAGAVVGAAVMYDWSARDPTGAAAMLEGIPAIGPQMIARVGDRLARWGMAAIPLGGVSGVPFKIYAVMAAKSGFGLAVFLAFALPARLARFAVAVVLADAIGRGPLGGLAARQRVLTLAGFWVLFYVVYWRLVWE